MLAQAVIERAEELVGTAGACCGHSVVLQDTARALCGQSGVLQDTARGICADSLWIKVRAQDARGARRLAGGSDLDTPLVATIILEASLCGDCIGLKADMPHWRVADTLSRLRLTLAIMTTIGQCDRCLKTRVVHRLG